MEWTLTDIVNGELSYGGQEQTNCIPFFASLSQVVCHDFTDLALLLGPDVNIKATGTLHNIGEYGEVAFKNDEDQKWAFEVIIAAYVLQLHKEASQYSDGSELNRKHCRLLKIRESLEKVNHDLANFFCQVHEEVAKVMLSIHACLLQSHCARD
jgi:hypothetical protein